MLISLVVPCFDEEEALPHLLAALDQATTKLRAAGHRVERIFVDDGSRDGTFGVLKAAAAARDQDFRVVRFRRNFGQTAALAAGFSHSHGEVIVALDADLQNDPDDIPLLLEKIDEGYDVVSGWRKDRHDATITRKIPSKVANWVISKVSGVHLHDYGCTLKAYRRDVVEPMRLYGEMHRFIPVYASWIGAKITELPVRHHPRRFGRAKYGLERVPKVILDLLVVRFLSSFSTKPIYVFGGFGLISFVLAFLAAGLAVYYKLAHLKDFIQTPLPMLTTLLILVGVLSILMGFLAELTVRTYHEASARPTYVVREVVAGGQGQAQPCAESAESSA
ncbi:MAG TPA: glycosyltransferase [Polyangia bacterium]